MHLDSHPARDASLLAFVTLEALPCGCVAAVYEARPESVELELIEAKGPHCVFGGHKGGHVVRLGMPRQLGVD